MRSRGGVTAKNLRNVEWNIQRWLERRALTEPQRVARNRYVSLARGLVTKWRSSVRTERSLHKRHLRNERAKARRAGS